jgi:hypothetical protein
LFFFYFDFDLTLTLCDSPAGRFLRLQSRTTKDRTHVQSLNNIALGDTPAFLNLANISSFPVQPRDARDAERLIYTVGNVFLVDEPLPVDRVESVVFDHKGSASSASSRHKSASSAASSRNKSDASSQRSGNGLMRCLDERGTPIMVPTNQVGRFID